MKLALRLMVSALPVSSAHDSEEWLGRLAAETRKSVESSVFVSWT